MAPWITVLSRHTVFTVGMIYKFTLEWYSAKKGTTHMPTSHLAHLDTVLFLWPREEHRRQGSWVEISRASVYYCDSRVWKHFLFRFWCQQSAFHWWLPRRLWFFFSGHCYRHLQRSALFTLLCTTRHSCSNSMPLRYELLLQWQQNISKVTMWRM